MQDSEFNLSLGYLIYFSQIKTEEGSTIENAVFSVNGLVDGYSKEDVDRHNELYCQAEIEGLDDNCKIGQGSYFYVSDDVVAGKTVGVKTWTGMFVAVGYVCKNEDELLIIFARKNRLFIGRLDDTNINKEKESVFFARVT